MPCISRSSWVRCSIRNQWRVSAWILKTRIIGCDDMYLYNKQLIQYSCEQTYNRSMNKAPKYKPSGETIFVTIQSVSPIRRELWYLQLQEKTRGQRSSSLTWVIVTVSLTTKDSVLLGRLLGECMSWTFPIALYPSGSYLYVVLFALSQWHGRSRTFLWVASLFSLHLLSLLSLTRSLLHTN